MILTVKKEGTVDITATADDQGQCMGTLTVNIMDYAPVLESASVTVNKIPHQWYGLCPARTKWQQHYERKRD